MPMPVSWTAKRRRTSRADRTSTSTSTTTRPVSVNLMALPMRLVSTCSRRSGSPCSGPRALIGRGMRRDSPSARALGARRRSSLASRAVRSRGWTSMANLPASMRDRSRMSSMIPSRLCPAVWMRSSISRWLALRGSRPTIRARPMTEYSGVRISWLMWARNSLLARLASSASRCAWTSRSSAALRAVTSVKAVSRPTSSSTAEISTWRISPSPRGDATFLGADGALAGRRLVHGLLPNWPHLAALGRVRIDAPVPVPEERHFLPGKTEEALGRVVDQPDPVLGIRAAQGHRGDADDPNRSLLACAAASAWLASRMA